MTTTTSSSTSTTTYPPLTVCEAYFTYDTTNDSVTRVFNVQGDVLNCSYGPELAAFSPDIPAERSSQYFPYMRKTLVVLNKSSVRKGPDFCEVTVNYGMADTAEMSARETPGVPYNNTIDGNAIEDTIFVDLDGNTIGLHGEGAAITVPQVNWSFSVLTTYYDPWVANAGLVYNTDVYPATTTSRQPFNFAATTLLFMSCNMVRSTNPSYPNYWVATFNFAYRSDGWRYHRWSPTIEIPGKRTIPANVYFRDPFTGIETDYATYLTGQTGEAKRDWTATVPLYHIVDGEVRYIWSSRVRTGVAFQGAFNFTWS